jgi:LysR family glycine cleavage system transcriptional activator
MDWSQIPSLSALRAFEATARLLNFSKAAAELNVTHAAIAQHVRGLEADLGEQLVQRQGRGLALTQNGHNLAMRLQAGFEEISFGIDDLRRLHDNRPMGVTVTPAFAANWLMPRMGAFWRDHPDVSLNIQPSTEIVDLVRSTFDIAIRFGDGNWDGLKSSLLTYGDFYVVAHPDLVADRTLDCLKDTEDLVWLLDDHTMERRKMLEAEGLDFSKVNLQSMSNTAVILSAVLAGLGVTLQPRSLIERELERGELTVICRLKTEKLGYYLVWPETRDNKKMRTFRKWLLKEAQT